MRFLFCKQKQIFKKYVINPLGFRLGGSAVAEKILWRQICYKCLPINFFNIHSAFVCRKEIAWFCRICFVTNGLQYAYTAAPFTSRICGKLMRCKIEVVWRTKHIRSRWTMGTAILEHLHARGIDLFPVVDRMFFDVLVPGALSAFINWRGERPSTRLNILERW